MLSYKMYTLIRGIKLCVHNWLYDVDFTRFSAIFENDLPAFYPFFIKMTKIFGPKFSTFFSKISTHPGWLMAKNRFFVYSR